jgi:hypothetical protein
MTPNKQAGKGDKPRNCFSQQFRDNYDIIFKNSSNTSDKSQNTRINKRICSKPQKSKTN